MSNDRCLVVIPTYNEAPNVRRLIREVLEQDPAIDVLIVDDSSPDGTADIVRQIARDDSRVQMIERAGKQGLGTAYVAGFRYALQRGYRYIGQMDADFSHKPEYIPTLLGAVRDSYQVAIGSRNVPGGGVENWPLLRKWISRAGSLYTRTVLQLPVKDCTGGFKFYRAAALRQIDLDHMQAAGFGFQVEMNFRCCQAGLKMGEFPILFPDRMAGKSKMSLGIFMEAMWLVLRLRWDNLWAPQPRLHVGH